jgi:hypothetical protein
VLQDRMHLDNRPELGRIHDKDTFFCTPFFQPKKQIVDFISSKMCGLITLSIVTSLQYEKLAYQTYMTGISISFTDGSCNHNVGAAI